MDNFFDNLSYIIQNRDMKAKKVKCPICGDTIKGRKRHVRFLEGRKGEATIDTGCFFLLKERGLIKN